MYKNPAHDPTNHMNENQLQTDFDLFYEDVFMELAKFGEVEEMVVCDNVGDHLVGNVYCQFRLEESAGNAVTSLNNRFYAGKRNSEHYEMLYHWCTWSKCISSIKSKLSREEISSAVQYEPHRAKTRNRYR